MTINYGQLENNLYPHIKEFKKLLKNKQYNEIENLLSNNNELCQYVLEKINNENIIIWNDEELPEEVLQKIMDLNNNNICAVIKRNNSFYYQKTQWIFNHTDSDSTKFYYEYINLAGTKAQNTYAQSKLAGTLGNKIKIIIKKNIYQNNKYDVITYYNGEEVDLQTVSASTGLKANNYVYFKLFTMQIENGKYLSGGINSYTEQSETITIDTELED